jgi:hypothetical protein
LLFFHGNNGFVNAPQCYDTNVACLVYCFPQRPRRGVNRPSSSIAEVKERVELYLDSSYRYMMQYSLDYDRPPHSTSFPIPHSPIILPFDADLRQCQRHRTNQRKSYIRTEPCKAKFLLPLNRLSKTANIIHHLLWEQNTEFHLQSAQLFLATLTKTITSEISGVRSGAAEVSVLPEHAATTLCNSFQIFRDKAVVQKPVTQWRGVESLGD